MKSKRRQFIDKKLVIKLRLFAIIFLVMAGIGIYDITIGNLSTMLALTALACGIAVGWLLGWSSKVIWHEEDQKAITKMDIFGIVMLVAYILFAVFKQWIFGHWIEGVKLAGFTIWLSAGIMLGRVLSMRLMIINVLTAKGL